MTENEHKPAPAWSRILKHSRVKALISDQESSRGNDRSLIAEQIYRYGWSYDERDLSGLGECFSLNGVWEGLIMGEIPVGPFTGRESIVAWLTDFWKEQTDQRRHIFTNIVLDDLTPNSATAHAYLLLLASSNATLIPQTTGPYRFEMLKESDGVWRIQRLVAGFDVPF